MSDPRKGFQRNIRIEPELWEYVQSVAEKRHSRNGDCSAVIRAWIMERMAAHRESHRTMPSTACR